MDRVFVANELVRLAKKLTGGIFTVMKPLKLKKEGGGTRDSLLNAQMILDAGYKVKEAIYDYNKDHADYNLTVTFERGGEEAEHTFTALSWGYGGEGPHGLEKFGKMFNLGLDSEIIFGNKATNLPEKGVVDLLVAFR